MVFVLWNTTLERMLRGPHKQLMAQNWMIELLGKIYFYYNEAKKERGKREKGEKRGEY